MTLLDFRSRLLWALLLGAAIGLERQWRQKSAGLLPYLSKKVREDVIKLSSYPPETAGGIMGTDFATVHKGMTCTEAINKVRSDSPSKKPSITCMWWMTSSLCRGFITLKDLIIANPHTLVGIVTHDEAIEVIRAEHTEDLEKFMGMIPGKGLMDYSRTPVWQHFKKRVVWIASLVVVGLISGIRIAMLMFF
ncbi:magnesium transporter [Alkaliflexus imshenetskii]|uniref:magnesium transporter n=1 Tax=Alkaliflexus imshenetskii TaxID=286730 RepID=UPI00047A283A|nr:magnesium transporter [Alkaliflexus imshenetskii]